MKYFLIALQFLTIFPIKIKSKVESKDFAKALMYFPLVGGLIGLSLVLIVFLFGFLPKIVVSSLIVIVSVIITGAIHLDGFADTCDGFYASNKKEKILDIMRDSHIGAIGVIGIICILLLKFTLIASFNLGYLWRVLIVMGVFSRWAQSFGCCISNYAREDGKGKGFIKYSGKNELIVSTGITLVIMLLLMGIKGLFLFAGALIPVFLFIKYANKRIKGMTGDTIGAVNEFAEVFILLGSLI